MEKLKPLVNSPHWGALVDHFQDMHDKEVANIIFSKDDTETHRYQGKLEILRQLIRLKENVNKHV